MQSFIKCCSFLCFSLLAFAGCEDLDTVNQNNPDRQTVLTTGDDLAAVLRSGYAEWWSGVHAPHAVLALSVAADAYGLSRGDWGAQQLGQEPRPAYNNNAAAPADYRQVVELPWYGCLSAVSSANDVIMALDEGVTVDNGGPQDQSIRAAAHFLRGVSWGYLGLLFDQALLVDEQADPGSEISFSGYRVMIDAAVAELEAARSLAGAAGADFNHRYFNGLVLEATAFQELSHSYAARLLAQWPRTEAENAQVNWSAVLAHAEEGLTFDFAPLADGDRWVSYQTYAFAETGQGPFWARVDQRVVAALDTTQPARYPEVEALGEDPLPQPQATSSDQRLETDFIFLPENSFPAAEGEWHFSHYQHNRNQTQPDFAGDGQTTGPMPVFLQADNDLLRAEALLNLGRTDEAVTAINSGSRTERGGLPALPAAADPVQLKEAIYYERAVELLSTAPLGLWFDRRRVGPRQDYRAVDALGGLQTGTPAQLPVPAAALQIYGEVAYTFGGELDPMGVERIYE